MSRYLCDTCHANLVLHTAYNDEYAVAWLCCLCQTDRTYTPRERPTLARTLETLCPVCQGVSRSGGPLRWVTHWCPLCQHEQGGL